MLTSRPSSSVRFVLFTFVADRELIAAMESKRSTDFKSKWKKRTRQTISLEQKISIIERAGRGEKAVRIAETLGLPSSSVRSILGNTKNIYKSAKIVGAKSGGGGLDHVKRLKVQDSATSGEIQSAFVRSFKPLIKQNGYKAKQIFHVAETVLFWKEMPAKRTPETKEYFQEFRERTTLILGGNASGDFKLKPLMVHYLENPRALNGYPKDKLPVIWKTNKSTQVTQLIFSDWFTGYFCPTVKQYLSRNNLGNKALLILNDNSCHPTTLDDLSNNVKVLYLPQGIHDLILPVDLHVLRIFKAYYLQRALSQATSMIEANKADSLIDFWDNYDIKEAISNIAGAWEDVPSSNLNSLWKSLYPEWVRGRLESIRTTEEVVEKIMDLAKDLGVYDIDQGDIMEQIEYRNEEMSSDEAHQIEKMKAREEFLSEDYEDILPIKSLSPSLLRKAMTHMEAAMAIYKENDPDSERSSSVCRNIEKTITVYRKLERSKKNGQQSVSDFYRNIHSANELLLSPENISSSEMQSASYTLDVTFIKDEPDL